MHLRLAAKHVRPIATRRPVEGSGTAASTMLSEIVKRDRKIKTEADAEASMRQVLQELRDIRVEYDLPAVCPT